MNEKLSIFTASMRMAVQFPLDLFDESPKNQLYLDVEELNRYSMTFSMCRDDSWDEHTVTVSKIRHLAVFIIPNTAKSFAVNIHEKDLTQYYLDLSDVLEVDEESAFVYLLLLPVLCRLMDSGIYISNRYQYD